MAIVLFICISSCTSTNIYCLWASPACPACPAASRFKRHGSHDQRVGAVSIHQTLLVVIMQPLNEKGLAMQQSCSAAIFRRGKSSESQMDQINYNPIPLILNTP